MSTTRFKEAQERFGEYETALEEIRQGRKRSHWIWYIFPQLKGLGKVTTLNIMGSHRWRRLRNILETRC